MKIGSADPLVARLIEQSPDATIFADTDGVIRLWNAAATRVFGYEEEAALGASLDIIIPERFRDAHWHGFNRAINNGVGKHVGEALPTRAVRSDGEAIYVEMSFAVVTGASGTSLGALAHARDITERFEKERADRKRLQALEAALADN